MNDNILVFKLKVLEWLRKIQIRKYKKYSDAQIRHAVARFYKKRTGKDLDWYNLNTYNEKMQWLKLYDDLETKSILSDKYLVRNWVANKIGEGYLVPLLGVWNSFEEIDLSLLPDSFVLKVNNSSGTNIIVEHKDELNIKVSKARINYWMAVDRSFYFGFEMHYSMIRPRIICEEYIEHEEIDLPDYKFLCFEGKVYYCWVDVGRYHNHKRNIYDLEWNLQPWNQFDYGNSEEIIPKPDNFDEMIKIAHILCQGFKHVRVDLYNSNGKIYFSEMTFSNGSGVEPIYPEEYNKMLGDLIVLPDDYKSKYRN